MHEGRRAEKFVRRKKAIVRNLFFSSKAIAKPWCEGINAVTSSRAACMAP